MLVASSCLKSRLGVALKLLLHFKTGQQREVGGDRSGSRPSSDSYVAVAPLGGGGSGQVCFLINVCYFVFIVKPTGPSRGWSTPCPMSLSDVDEQRGTHHRLSIFTQLQKKREERVSRET